MGHGIDTEQRNALTARHAESTDLHLKPQAQRPASTSGHPWKCSAIIQRV